MHAFPTFNFRAGTGLTPISRDKAGITQSKTMQFGNNLTFILGKHTFKGRLDVRRVGYFDLESFAPNQEYVLRKYDFLSVGVP